MRQRHAVGIVIFIKRRDLPAQRAGAGDRAIIQHDILQLFLIARKIQQRAHGERRAAAVRHIVFTAVFVVCHPALDGKLIDLHQCITLLRKSCARALFGCSKNSFVFPSSTIFPSSKKTIRVATSLAKPISWVTMTIVMP